MKNGISIVMTYHNRKNLLIKTLNSIKKSNYDKDKLEIIIVDDCSSEDEKINDLVTIYKDLNIKLIVIKEKQKKWINCCIPYNIGFNHINYDKVIIQNPEVYHNGDILSYVNNNLNDDVYITHACYSLTWENTNKDNYENIKINNISANGAIHDGWYNHPIYKPTYYHYCSAITYNNLCKINGFDERYKDGIGYDDNELVERIKNLNIKLDIIEEPFVLHQAHNSIFRFNKFSPEEEKEYKLNLFQKNSDLFYDITKNEKKYRAEHNTYFNKNIIKIENNLKYQKEKLTILIPFMNREENLSIFIPYMKNYMKNYFPEIKYNIVVVEQINNKPFNKGILFNAGFILTSGNTDYYALHDVDQIPISADYTYNDWVNHICVNCIEQSNDGIFKNTYKDDRFRQKGGAIIVDKNIYLKTNGHSNLYWGWGCIDDDFAIRSELVGYYFKRYENFMNHKDIEKNKKGYFISLKANTKRFNQDSNYSKNVEIINNFLSNHTSYKKDGLNNLQFELLEEIITNEYIRYKITF